MSDKKDNIIRLVHASKPENCTKIMEVAGQLDWAAVVITGWVNTKDGLMEYSLHQTATYQDAVWLLERCKQAVMAEHDYELEPGDD